MKLFEIFDGQVHLQEAKEKSILGRIVFQFGLSDFKNQNERIYPHKILSKAVDEFDKKVQEKNRKLIGTLEHPLPGRGILQKASHFLEKVWMDGKRAMAQAAILNTTAGKDTFNLLKAGASIGASLRGYGNTSRLTKTIDGKQQEVELIGDDFKLASVDIVGNPSFGDQARIDQRNIIESGISYSEEQETLTEKDKLILLFQEAKRAGYRGKSLKEYRDDFEV